MELFTQMISSKDSKTAYELRNLIRSILGGVMKFSQERVAPNGITSQLQRLMDGDTTNVEDGTIQYFLDHVNIGKFKVE
jgi:hypothetical protein